MITLTDKDIATYYRKLVGKAAECLSTGKVDMAAFHLSNAATFSYNFNLIYTDPVSEDILTGISRSLLGQEGPDFLPIDERVVFYDAFSLDNRGLTQQYIRGLMASGREFLYIYGHKDPRQSVHIAEELDRYPKATCFEIDACLSPSEKIRAIFNAIQEYKPSCAILHIAPWSVEPLAVLAALPQVRTYNINLTDHAYWLGASVVDYNIEFRDYGAKVSLEKRGFQKEQIVLLPYYPITTDKEFEGFPEITQGKTVLFSGGSVYKVYGANGRYFDILRRILEENPDAVLLFAGSGNMRKMKDFIARCHFEDRIALLGNRSDINQVFKHADIYLNTYPITGGLMSQLAAVNGVPILTYTDPKYQTNYIEGVVCHNYELALTDDDYESFIEKASRLCRSKDERESMSEKLKKCVISPEQYNQELDYLLKHNKSVRPVHFKTEVDYRAFSDMYIEIENRFQPQMQFFLLKQYRLQAIYLFPKLIIKALPKIIRKIGNRI